jgi:hypothetical protein
VWWWIILSFLSSNKMTLFCHEDKFQTLPPDEAIAKCQTWIDTNPHASLDHKRTVQMVMAFMALKEENTAVIDENTALKEENTAVIDENTALKEENTVVIDENTALKEENTAVIDENTALKEENTAKSLGSLKKVMPVLADRTVSEPHFPKSHEHARLTIINCESDACWLERFPNFWEAGLWVSPLRKVASDSDTNISCDSESAALFHVMRILSSVLVGLGLDRVVELATNRTLAGVECDILLLYKPNRLPFATVEVKKPGAQLSHLLTIFHGEGGKDNRVAGQALDQCNAIKLFGYNQVFGLITNGNLFQMVCTTPIATSTTTAAATSTGPMTTRKKSGNATKLRKRSRKDDDDDDDDDDDKEIGNGLMAMNEQLRTMVVEWLTEKSAAQLPHPESGGAMNYNGNGGVAVVSTRVAVSPEPPKFEFRNQSLGGGIENKNERRLFASPIVPACPRNESEFEAFYKEERSGKAEVELMARFVLKAFWSLVEMLSRNDNHGYFSGPNSSNPSLQIFPRMPCRTLAKNEKAFAFGTVKLKKLQLDKFVPNNIQAIYVIHHIGSGANGTCCLGVSSKGGSCCAIKFFYRLQDGGEASNQAETELRNWEKVYGNDIFLPKSFVWQCPSTSGSCLIMPYLNPIPVLERSGVLDRIDEAMKRFCKSGYIHLEPNWRHIGTWNKEIYFCDLGSIKKMPDKESIARWRTTTMGKLRASASSQEDAIQP